MAHKDEIPYLTPRARATRRRELIASAVLFLVIVGCIVVTVVARLQQ